MRHGVIDQQDTYSTTILTIYVKILAGRLFRQMSDLVGWQVGRGSSAILAELAAADLIPVIACQETLSSRCLVLKKHSIDH